MQRGMLADRSAFRQPTLCAHQTLDDPQVEASDNPRIQPAICARIATWQAVADRRGDSMGTSFSQRGGGWVVGQALLMPLVIALGPLFPGRSPGFWGPAIGTLLIVVGGWLGIAGARALGSSRTVFPRPLAEASLVRSGPYRIVRHPLYLSVILIDAAWSAWWWSAPALAATVASALFFHLKAGAEERWLRQKFADYPQYAREVGRLFPRIL